MAYINGKEILFSPNVVLGGNAGDLDSINAMLDEINATLDEILATQEALTKPKLPTFTIEYNGVTYTFEYEENMTWGRWCASEYNTETIYGSKFHISDYGQVMHVVSYVNDYENCFRQSEDGLIRDYDHYIIL